MMRHHRHLWIVLALAACSSSDGASSTNGDLVSIVSYARTPACSRTGDTVTVTWTAQNAEACSFAAVFVGADPVETDALPTSGSVTTVVPHSPGLGYANLWCYRGGAVSWSDCPADRDRVDTGQGANHYWSKAGSTCGWAEMFLVNTDADGVPQEMGCASTGAGGSGGTGGSGGASGSTRDPCLRCLDSCRGMSGCCTGSGCICASAC